MTKPLGPYRPIVRAGDFLITSGQVGVADGAIVTGGIQAETRQAIANVRSLLEGEGASLADVVKTSCFLLHMRDFGIMNEVYAEAFVDNLPARSTVAVVELPAGAIFEIEAWAYVPLG